MLSNHEWLQPDQVPVIGEGVDNSIEFSAVPANLTPDVVLERLMAYERSDGITTDHFCDSESQFDMEFRKITVEFLLSNFENPSHQKIF